MWRGPGLFHLIAQTPGDLLASLADDGKSDRVPSLKSTRVFMNKYEAALEALKAHKSNGGIQSKNSPFEGRDYFSPKTAASFIARDFAKFENGLLVFLPKSKALVQCNGDESNFSVPIFKKTSSFQKKLLTDRSLFMLTREYQDWKIAVLTRDEFKCVNCGSREKLEADHVKPYALYPELRTDINNGMTLCHDCHVKTETYGGKANKFVSVECQKK